MPGAAIDQHEAIMQNMVFALRTWQIDKKQPDQHTGDDIEFMREYVQPKRGG